MANIDGLYTNQGNGVWGSNNQIIGTTRVLAFSTTTPLGANAVYTSPTIDAINYKGMTLSGLSDQAGSYIFQHSDDGIKWISTPSSATTANTGFTNLTSAYRRYCRLVYTNGAVAQTTFDFSGYTYPL